MIRSNVTIYRMRAELHGGSAHFLCQKIRKGRRLRQNLENIKKTVAPLGFLMIE